MIEPKSRRSSCPISYALEIFGDRWTLLVLRDMILYGRQRFRDLLASDEGIASNILTDRLKRLEALGIVSRMPDPTDGRQIIYRVTERGLSLIPVMLEIAAWGAAQDGKTAAPADFVASFHADREAFHTRYRAWIDELYAGETGV